MKNTTNEVSAPQSERAAPLQLERIDAPELLEEARRAYAERLRRRLGVLIAQRDAALSRARTACAAYEAALADAAFEEAKAVEAQLKAALARGARGTAEALP